ncbi:alcohol dehydrogenase [Apiospora rasikravindrae]|uniref:Alcohol dehydrogenase n=1 Tax=Apiospora rasikravindrae TaxID=990691 RepID=A0ABR1TX34_9PEZI
MSVSPGMKAWTYTSGGYPASLQKTTIPSYEAPLKPDQLRIRVKAASLNPVDAQLMGNPLWPYIPEAIVRSHKGVGEDFSGVVEEAGTSSGFKAGDEVFGIAPFLPEGTLQEVIRIDVDSSSSSVVLPKPADWSWEQAAAVPLVWITAQTCIAKAAPWVPAHGNGKIAILGGSSSCGIYAVHIAKQRGWEVAATCSGKNAEHVRSMDADTVIDYTSTDVSEQVKAFSPDAIIDFVGGVECLGLARRYVTVVGDKTSRLTIGGKLIYLWNPQMVLRALLGRIGLGFSYTCINLEVRRPNLEGVLRLPKDKIFIDSTYGFDEAMEAFDRLNSSRARGKVIVRVST